MWCHIGVPRLPGLRFVRLRPGLGLLAATWALAIIALPGAAAATPTPSSELSLAFPSESAHLAGSQALVLVKCLGSEASTCSGTLTLRTGGNKHKVPFSVSGGTSQNLTVPLGGDSSAKRAVAIARTAQAGGGYVRSSEVLHLH
jgi:hypothetical protein